MLSECTQNFVSSHRQDDVRQLALRGCKEPGVDLTAALQQIAGWQTACRKLPTWARTDGLWYPPHLSMEQCSGEVAARYKAALLAGVLASPSGNGAAEITLVDLTGGLGADFTFLSPLFSHAVYVERQEALCQLARHNFPLLGLNCAEVVCAEAESHLAAMPPATVIFMDPARRDAQGGRTYGISDCTPDVTALLPVLLSKTQWLLLKLSPMLDWRKAVADVGPSHVRQVHIVSVGGECKELLLLLSATASAAPLQLVCANDGERFVTTPATPATPAAPAEPQPGHYLYEPNASVMKAGCFAAVAQQFGVSPLAHDSHLFTGPQMVSDFPGRKFQISAVSSMNKRELKALTASLTQANITVRHFPLTAVQLRQRLKIGEGGGNYLFATTLANGCRVLILCQKAG